MLGKGWQGKDKGSSGKRMDKESRISAPRVRSHLLNYSYCAAKDVAKPFMTIGSFVGFSLSEQVLLYIGASRRLITLCAPIYRHTVCNELSPALNGGSEVWRFDCSDAINGTIFDFYL